MPQRPWAVTAMSAALVAACGGRTDAADAGADVVAGEVLVSAASSLTDAFSEIAAAFETAHPGVDVSLNLGGSSSLRAQILDGAPIDVFASANAENMSVIADAGLVAGETRAFARNVLRIAVPRGNPAGIEGLEDFADPSLRIGLCAEEVPCGAFAGRALERAGVVAAPDTREPDVRALLTKVELGELDAGITYATDVAAAGGTVQGVDIPARFNVLASYPIAVLSSAPNPVAARAFLSFVVSERGRSILARYGFETP